MSIWPSRIIELARPHSMSREEPRLVAAERIDQIRTVLEPFGRHLDVSTLLHTGKQLVALIHLGTDGVGGNGALLVLVTNTAGKSDSALHLEAMPYGAIGGSDKKRYVPSMAGQVLDMMVERITEVLGDIVASSKR